MSVANPEAANEAQAQLFEKQAVTKEQQIEEATEAERKKQKIFDAIGSEIFTIRVYGFEIETRQLDGSEEDWLEDEIQGFTEIAEVEEAEDLGTDEFTQYRNTREDVVELLVDISVDETWDKEFWKKVPQETRYDVLRDVRAGGQEAKTADGFRQK